MTILLLFTGEFLLFVNFLLLFYSARDTNKKPLKIQKTTGVQRNFVINSIKAPYVLYGIYNEVSLKLNLQQKSTKKVSLFRLNELLSWKQIFSRRFENFVRKLWKFSCYFSSLVKFFELGKLEKTLTFSLFLKKFKSTFEKWISGFSD